MGELYEHRKESVKPRPVGTNPDDKHIAMMLAIAPFAKNKVQSNVTDVEFIPSTKKTKLMLILLPEWSPNFPPFNVARLAAVSKKAGYDTKCLDLNIKIHNESRKWIHEGKLDFDPFDGAREWKWLKANYYTDLHPLIEPFVKQYIQQIVDFKPDVIGFTMYYCNEEPVLWMAQEIKKVLPDVKIMLGGPNVALRTWQIVNEYPQGVFDYAVNGEGELILLQILNEIERGVKHDTVQILAQPEEQRLNINNLPLPDYTDFDFNEYVFPNGINTEFSRGCVAKCTFCEETHFWKYRQRNATDAISEIEHLYYTRGTDVIWFIDSLVNGNLNELRAFCKAVVAKEMELHWTGYCRCDGRMDLEYYKDLKAAGCEMLNYGIESGSQKVLNDMAKGVTIEEMEQNFESGKIVGISAFTNWIVGFPTEDYQDFADSLTFIWRNRNQNVLVIAAGFGFGLGMNTVAGQNPERYDLQPFEYMGSWVTNDWRLTKLHVLNRVKSFAVFLQQLITEKHIHIPHRPDLPKDHYTIRFHNPQLQKEIQYEKFDYTIIKPNINPLADTLVNEMFVLFRMIWRIRGGFDMEIKYDEDLDMKEFGIRNAAPYWANHSFTINRDGVWSAKFKFKFKQPRHEDLKMQIPFKFLDFSHNNLNASKRARKIAKPRWGENGRTSEEFQEMMALQDKLNAEIDYSFEYEWEGTGKWEDPTATYNYSLMQRPLI
jgi:anaerobic magnesium-protoporphyrin IX monomethyl ester cyclase